MPRRLVLAVAGAVLVAVAVPSPALGKGPLAATLEGPGLDEPIRFGGWVEPGADDPGRPPVGRLAEATGFSAAASGYPYPLLAERPTDDLGPRYTVTYDVGPPHGDQDQVVQDVFPYAEPDPVTYTAPGQRVYGGMETRDGWYVATNMSVPPLMYILTEAGLPKDPPTTDDGSPFPWAVTGVLAASGAALGLTGLGIVLVRRRHPHRVDPWGQTPRV